MKKRIDKETGRTQTWHVNFDRRNDPPRIAPHHNNRVSQEDGFINPMRHHKRGCPAFQPDTLQFAYHLASQDEIQRPKRFIKKKNARLRHKRPGQYAALSHATRQRRLQRPAEILQAHQCKQAFDPLPRLWTVMPDEFKRQGHVRTHVPPRKECRILKRHAQRALATQVVGRAAVPIV